MLDSSQADSSRTSHKDEVRHEGEKKNPWSATLGIRNQNLGVMRGNERDRRMSDEMRDVKKGETKGETIEGTNEEMRGGTREGTKEGMIEERTEGTTDGITIGDMRMKIGPGETEVNLKLIFPIFD